MFNIRHVAVISVYARDPHTFVWSPTFSLFLLSATTDLCTPAISSLMTGYVSEGVCVGRRPMPAICILNSNPAYNELSHINIRIYQLQHVCSWRYFFFNRNHYLINRSKKYHFLFSIQYILDKRATIVSHTNRSVVYSNILELVSNMKS